MVAGASMGSLRANAAALDALLGWTRTSPGPVTEA